MRKLALALFLAAFFLFFNWDALSVGFAADDPMNIYGYWKLPLPRVLLNQFAVCHGSERPMGALFYLPLFQIFGLDPKPYHAAILLLMLATAFLVYRFARLLGCGELAAAVASVIACYHAGIGNIYFNTSFTYDVLCAFFFFATCVFYMRLRSRARPLSTVETGGFLVLFLCALNSKEMAATIPAVLLAYEWIFHGRPRWTSLAIRPVLLAALLDILYAYGKLLSRSSLAALPGYRPVYSRHRIVDFQIRSLGDIFLAPGAFTAVGALIVWLLVTYICWRRANQPLRFCWFFILLTPLPIEFLPGRRMATLYIPMIGWAIIAALVFADLLRAASRFLASEPLIGRLGRRGWTALLLLACLLLWTRVNLLSKRRNLSSEMRETGPLTAEAIRQLRSLNPRVRPGARVVFLNDPFDDWDMFFISALWFRDRTIDIRLHRKTPLSPEEIAKSDTLLTFEDGRLLPLK